LLFIEHAYGRDEFLNGLLASKKTVNTFYGKSPGYTIVHNNLKDMKDVTSIQTYQKGSWILHMLRGVVGTDTFWKGIQSYYKKYYNLNASTNDFRKEMEEASGKDLSTFFQQWLYKPGALKLAGTWKYDKDIKQVSVKIDQVQNGYLFKMPLEIGLYFSENDRPKLERVNLEDKSTSFSFKVDSEPQKVIIDPNTWILMDCDFKKVK